MIFRVTIRTVVGPMIFHEARRHIDGEMRDWLVLQAYRGGDFTADDETEDGDLWFTQMTPQRSPPDFTSRTQADDLPKANSPLSYLLTQHLGLVLDICRHSHPDAAPKASEKPVDQPIPRVQEP